jgi:hypothetical protein
MAGGKDIVIRAAIEGAGEVAKSLKDLQGQLDKLAIEGAKSGDPFKSIPRTAQQATTYVRDLNTQVGLTRMQSQQLLYTFNDVTASIASGISPMTILFQQSGNLTQAFGGIGNTVKALLPQLLKWGPAIAAAAGAAAAVVGTFNVLNKGAEAAKKMSDLADATERARVSQEFLNKLSAAGIAAGIPADQANKFAEDSVVKLRNALLGAKDAQVEFNKSRNQFAKTVRPPGAGDNPFDQIEQAGKFLKTVRPPADGAKIGPIVDKYAQLKDIFSKLGVDVTDLTGREDKLVVAIQRISDAFKNVRDEAKKFQIGLELDKILGPKLSGIIQNGGMDAINKADAEAAKLGPRPTSGTVKAGQEANIVAQQNLAAEQNKTLMMDAALISSSRAKAESRRLDLAKEANDVSLLNQAYQRLNDTITAAYQIKAGNQQAAQANPVLNAIVNAPTTAKDSAFGAVSGIEQTLGPAIQAAVTAIGDLAFEAAKAAGALKDTSNAANSSGTFPLNKASGGFISGPGTSTSDSIPAWLSSGEYVVRASAVKHYGVGLMHAINGMSARPRGLGFAAGGLVPPSAAIVGGSSSGRGLTLVLDNKTFSGFSGSSGAMDSLERYAIQRRLSSTTKRTPSRVG